MISKRAQELPMKGLATQMILISNSKEWFQALVRIAQPQCPNCCKKITDQREWDLPLKKCPHGVTIITISLYRRKAQSLCIRLVSENLKI